MTVRPPAQVLHQYIATFGDGGLEAAEEFWDPDIEWHALEADDTGVVRGRNAMRSYYAEWVDTMDELRGELCEVVFEDDERVVAQVRNFGRGRVSGVPVSGNYFVVCLVRDGLIVIAREYASREEALRGLDALTEDGG